ncbi:MAG TPA: hypothetical protein VMF89_09800, partial [Polyangiales bacterium]|nr:hypothetical protein [Polyangiales bacterium]
MLAGPMALAAAGKVLLVSGVAKLALDGERSLQKGDEIAVGDVISTDLGSRVQLLMADGARIVLQPGSSVRIDEFAMPSSVTRPEAESAVASPGKSVATLLSGRVDASAGVIGTITFNRHGAPVTLSREQSKLVSLDAMAEPGAPPALIDADHPPELSIEGHSRLGLGVDLLEARLPLLPQASTAVATPASSRPAFVASTTERADTLTFNSGGSVLQFNAMFGSGTAAQDATYLSGNAALLDYGANGKSGIRWGRWSTGTASISTKGGSE